MQNNNERKIKQAAPQLFFSRNIWCAFSNCPPFFLGVLLIRYTAFIWHYSSNPISLQTRWKDLLVINETSSYLYSTLVLFSECVLLSSPLSVSCCVAGG